MSFKMSPNTRKGSTPSINTTQINQITPTVAQHRCTITTKEGIILLLLAFIAGKLLLEWTSPQHTTSTSSSSSYYSVLWTKTLLPSSENNHQYQPANLVLEHKLSHIRQTIQHLSQDASIVSYEKTLSSENTTTPSPILPLPALEELLAHKEQERSLLLYQQLLTEGYEIYGFYHISPWKSFWQDVVEEQLRILDGYRKFPIQKDSLFYSEYMWKRNERFTSVLEMSTKLLINIAARNVSEFETVQHFITSLNLTFIDRIEFNWNQTIYRQELKQLSKDELQQLQEKRQVSVGEYPTMMMMRGFCRRHVLEQDALATNISFSRLLQKSRDLIPFHYAGGETLFRSQASTTPSSGKQGSVPPRKKALVYYLHAKGSCCQHGQYKPPLFTATEATKDNEARTETGASHDRQRATIATRLASQDSIALWREYMNSFNLEFPSLCMEKVGIEKYSVCGVEASECNYLGNHFWSDCDHIAQLPVLHDPLRWPEPEQFIGRLIYTRGYECEQIFQHCAYSLFSSTIQDLYLEKLPRSEYLPMLYKRLMKPSKDLKSQSRRKHVPANHSFSDQLEQNFPAFCRDIRNPSKYQAMLQQVPKSVFEEVMMQMKLPIDYDVKTDKDQALIRHLYIFLRPMIEYFSTHPYISSA